MLCDPLVEPRRPLWQPENEDVTRTAMASKANVDFNLFFKGFAWLVLLNSRPENLPGRPSRTLKRLFVRFAMRQL